MGRLSNLQQQIEAKRTGLPVQQSASPMDAVVEAIHGIQLNIEADGKDYSDQFNALGMAVKDALKTHGNALIKALDKITVNVESPVVNVAAPAVTVNPEFEIELPEIKPQPFSMEFERNNNGELIRAHVTDYKPTVKAEIQAVME